MITYLVVYAVLVLLGLGVRDRTAAPVLVVACLFLLWFMGARYEVGCDFTGYLHRFNEISRTASLGDALELHEPGFQILITGIRLAGLDYVWLNVAASALILFGYYRFLRAHPRPLMVLALLFPVMILQLSMSGIRQGIGVAMLMSASVDFMRGHRLRTALWIALGAQFHVSAAIFLPIALVAGRHVSAMRLVVATAALAPVAALLVGDRIDVYQNRYIDQIYGAVSSGGALLRYGLVFAAILMFFLFRRDLRVTFPQSYQLLFIFALAGLALLPVYFISSLLLHRMNYYVLPFSILTMVYASSVMYRRGYTILGPLLPATIYGIYIAGWLSLSLHAGICYLPYDNYLFAPTN